jgi:hypothetical protein
MDTQEENCSQCRFAAFGFPKTMSPECRNYTCRRYPPKLAVDLTADDIPANWESEWTSFCQPTVEGEDWCGEFKPRDVEKDS